MAGRRAHIDSNRFVEFLEAIPEDAKSQGFWRIKKETDGGQGRGVVHTYVGYLPFTAQESYDALRIKIKDSFGEFRGPGIYYAIPCDDRKAEIKNTDQVKFTFTEQEIPMPAPTGSNATNAQTASPFDAIKKVHKDVAEVRAMEMQEKLMEKILGKKDKDEEDDVKDTTFGGGGMQEMLMYKMMFGEDKKTSEPAATSAGMKELMDAKMDLKMSEMKAMIAEGKGSSGVEKLMEKLVDLQTRPQDDKFEKLLERMMAKEEAARQSDNKENVFQSMMAMMAKQAEERDKQREADERRRQEDQKEERRRIEDERKEEKRRQEDEARRRDEDRKEEKRREEELRRAEMRKYESELEEQRRRFDAELMIRREEIKSEATKAREYALEQGKMQAQLFTVFKENKDSSLDITTKIVDTLTGAGLSSMKTAQQAAESIMSIASKVDKTKDKEDEFSIGGLLKDLGPLAGSLLAPYADADAKMKMLQSISKVAGAGGLEQLAGAFGGPMPDAPPQQRQMPQMPPQMPRGDSAQRPSRPAQAPKQNGGMNVLIQNFLQKCPEIKYAMLSNMQEKLGVDMFIDIILGLDQPVMNSLMVNLPPQFVANAVAQVCTPEEKNIIAANMDWFVELKKLMIEELSGDDDDDDAEDGASPASKPKAAPAQAAAPAPKPVPQVMNVVPPQA
jgi:hypothetical protein